MPWLHCVQKTYIELPLRIIENSYLSNLLNFEMGKYRAYAKADSKLFKEYNGEKYSKFIDPRTGLPASRQILTAVVFANDCSIADAYATSFIVMGIDDAVPLIESNPYEGVEAYFIYQTEDGELQSYVSSGLEDYFVK